MSDSENRNDLNIQDGEVEENPKTPTKPSDRKRASDNGESPNPPELDYAKIQRVDSPASGNHPPAVRESPPSDHNNRSSSHDEEGDDSDCYPVDEPEIQNGAGKRVQVKRKHYLRPNIDVGTSASKITRTASDLKTKLTRYEKPCMVNQSENHLRNAHGSSQIRLRNDRLRQNLPRSTQGHPLGVGSHQMANNLFSRRENVMDFQVETCAMTAPVAIDVSPVKRPRLPSRIPRVAHPIPRLRSQVQQDERNNLLVRRRDVPASRRGPAPIRTGAPLMYVADIPDPEPEFEHDYGFNIHAQDSDGYDQETDLDRELHEEAVREEVEYQRIQCVGDEEVPGPPINQELATILETNWTKPKTLDQLKKGLFPKYAPPENCAFTPPDVNPEIRGLGTSNKRNVDVQLRAIQKSLAKAMHAGIKMFEEAKSPQPSLQNMAQSLADMSAILGHATHDISKRRRQLFVYKMEPKYFPLQWEKEEDNLLFGKDFTQKVKDVKLKDSIQKSVDKTSGKKSFLGKGNFNKAQYQNNGKKKNRKKGKGKKGGNKQAKEKDE